MEITKENNCLESLELRLYQAMDDVLNAGRFDDAMKIAKVMQMVGIV